MPMIDVYAAEGTFKNKHALATDLAAAVMRWEKVPNISLFRNNTAAFIHELPADSLSNVAGDSNYVRVQVLTPVGVLDRDKQLGVVRDLTNIVAAAAGDPQLTERTWVLITESPEGGWGLQGHANTSADIVAAARRELAAQERRSWVSTKSCKSVDGRSPRTRVSCRPAAPGASPVRSPSPRLPPSLFCSPRRRVPRHRCTSSIRRRGVSPLRRLQSSSRSTCLA